MTHIQHTRASIRTPYTHRHTVIARGYFLQPLCGVSAVLTFSAFPPRAPAMAAWHRHHPARGVVRRATAVAARLRRCAAAPTGRKRLPPRSQGRVRVPAQARPGPQAAVSEVPAEVVGASGRGGRRRGSRRRHRYSPGSLSTPSASDHSGGSFGPHGQVLREKLGG